MSAIPTAGPGSLRRRLIVSMSLSVLAGVGIVALLHEAAETGRGAVERVSRLMLGDELAEPWQDVAVLLPFGIVVLGLVSVVTVWSLRPLVRASEEARLVGPSNPGARIGIAGLPAEITPLVSAMNGALDRLARAFENERRFTQDAAHELRTPLAALGLRLQNARIENAPEWGAIERDLGRMGRLVAGLLDLARKEQIAFGAGAMPAPTVNLARVAREAAAAIVPLAQALGRTLDVDAVETAQVAGRADDLRDMITNLLENALVHGRGCVTLTCRVASLRAGSASAATVEVADEGPGVPESLRTAVFDRFRKGSQDSEGSGLGLAIARAVATAHGGALDFVDGPTCRISVAIPALSAIDRTRLNA